MYRTTSRWSIVWYCEEDYLSRADSRMRKFMKAHAFRQALGPIRFVYFCRDAV